ncbi:Protein FANTASTIC FOUR like [Quillaja saponaria]|uniref:Protein FANTASTIC FOUR like n=1 Tax=Quillaja saponaria TaxID=32244 RepID=A0AAD7QGS8_QUISA|nr:Protein FANTASTIC FOUR like [Quillaja saponaria]
MAACGSLQHFFENPLPASPTLFESLSPWNQIKPVKSIFGELHFEENSESSFSSSSFRIPISFSSPSLIDLNHPNETEKKIRENYVGSENSKRPSSSTSVSSPQKSNYTNSHTRSDSFSSSNSSLQLCTEGLGSESSDEVELKNGTSAGRENQNKEVGVKKKLYSHYSFSECRRSRTTGVELPPPISSIGQSGKPWLCFKPYRQDGRFVLKVIRVPTQEFLLAYREDGRLKLHFIQPNDGSLEDEDEDEEDEEEEEEEEESKNKMM